jgi:alpha-galactosidase
MRWRFPPEDEPGLVIQSTQFKEGAVQSPIRLGACWLVAAVALTAAAGGQGQPAWMDIAKTPPMGWNSWNKFGCNVSESLVREVADAMVASGMKDAGYQYVVIDDCWQVARTDGSIVPDPDRFKGGMKALADYVHSRGLKFGLYSDAGARTCEGRPASNGYEVNDARQYAAWGVDYLKYDWCNTDGVDPKIAYPTMRDALKSTGRPVVFSMCEWGDSRPWTWARGVAHLWRTTGDIQDRWSSFTRLLDRQVGLEKYAGPGGWNDPDMLEVGNGGMTTSEYRAHFSLWCLLSAPLLAGNDIRTMTPETRDLLTNKEVIALDQDPLEQGRRLRKERDLEVWVKTLAGQARAVVLFNRGEAAAPMAVSWLELGLPYDAEPAVRDLWAKKDLGRVKGTFATTVPGHDVVVIKVTP